ncbi:MAG TPA: methyltransferase domain-containing protein [Steroidobacteraceae bacterium]|jgi:ubiquinone/menaquinone biosynthesis C-methylase UbiE|nr:methyltransferase domain-containing protein [Steroidobacteraceae bacterium]
MESRLQRRVQRYGWDLAASEYETLWQAQLRDAQQAALAATVPASGEHVLDVACGTGLVAFAAARAIGPRGAVLGTDISGEMVAAASSRAEALGLANVRFARMDAEALELPDASFEVAVCALGLMYVPSPEQALRELWRVLRPGGRLGLAVWGERARCGWSEVFPIVAAEVSSEVCPLFFRLGQADVLAQLCRDTGFRAIEATRISTTLRYAHAEEACRAAFVGGPVALAWSRFSAEARARVCQRYLAAIAPWRQGEGVALPGEFVIVGAQRPG